MHSGSDGEPAATGVPSVDPIAVARPGDEVPGWRSVLDALPDAIAVIASDGTITVANAALERLAGYPIGTIGGTPLDALLTDPRDPHRIAIERSLAGDDVAGATGIPTRCRRRDGTEVPVSLSLSAFALDGRRYVVCDARDDTERLRTEDELFYRSTHDGLTGLANRSLAFDRLALSIEKYRRSRRPVSVLFIDLDRFKRVNDVYGHARGDEVLREVAACAATAVRPGDTVARIGGDEFLVVCDEAGPKAALDVARRVLGRLSASFAAMGLDVDLAASVGVATASTVTVGAEDLVAAADAAMYDAKRAGGSRVAVSGAGDRATVKRTQAS